MWFCCCKSGSRGSGSAGSQGSEGSGSVFFNETCCTDVRGDFWDISGGGSHVSALWPASLTLTMAAACCDALKGPFTLNPKADGLFAPFHPFYDNDSGGFHFITDCHGHSREVYMRVSCDLSGANLGKWLLFMSGGFFPFPGTFTAELTLLSCVPLHLVLPSLTITDDGNWCNGASPVEITQ